MLHPLPPRPSVTPSSQSLPPIPPSTQAQPSSLVSHQGDFCPICPSLPTPNSSQPTKYTCPRCSIRTCSLRCSNFHKSLYNCSGERNKAKYIKMNEYGYGELMNDYVYLEEVGRRVKDWGGEMVRDGLDQNTSDKKGKRKAMATSMRGGRGSRHVSGKGLSKSKRDVLKLQLEARDIYMEFLPLGMERRRLNQSTWDSKSQSASLTIEFVLHPPHSPFTSFEPITILNHRNNLSTPLIKLLESCVEDRLQKANKASAKSATGTPKTATLPDWIHDLLPPHDPSESEAPTLPFFLIRLSELPKIDIPIPQASKGKHIRLYQTLGPNDPLSTSLRDIPFIEFPTIEVVDPDAVSEGAFDGVIVQEASIHPSNLYHNHNHRSPKRRRVTVDKQTFTGLLHGYGSSGSASDGEEAEDGKGKEKSALEGLGGYDSSDDGEGGLEQQEQQPREDVMRDDSDSDEDVEIDLDPKALEELVKLAQHAGGQEEEVDWDDSDVE